MRPRALLTNDDGYDSPALEALRERLSQDYDVTIVAPDCDRSCIGRSVTLRSPIKVEQVDDQTYKCSGTPTDCVMWALATLFAEDYPEVAFSGVNTCYNLGTDVIYSGTVAAAMEAHLRGIPAVALSFEQWSSETDLQGLDTVLDWWKNQKSQWASPLLNINIPNRICSVEPKWCDLGTILYTSEIVVRGEDTFLSGSRDLEKMRGLNKDTDVDWTEKGYITVTPLQHHLTAQKVD